jgi:chromosome segregation ATPase
MNDDVQARLRDCLSTVDGLQDRLRDCWSTVDHVQDRLRDCLATVDHLQERESDCRATVDDLEEENRQLRLACEAFGQLAERLHVELMRVRAAAEWKNSESDGQASNERVAAPDQGTGSADVPYRRD